MPRLAITWDADWQPRKMQALTLQIRRLLISSGGVGSVSDIGPVDATLPAKKYLVLECRNNSFGKKCGAVWETQFFTPCPECGQRRFVHKAESRTEEPLPPVGDPPPQDPIPVEDQPEETAPPAA